MEYRVNSPPNLEDTAFWTQQELNQVARAFQEQDAIYLVELNVAPDKPRTGMTVLADGTNWNPGTGAGVYTYYGAAWHKLG